MVITGPQSDSITAFPQSDHSRTESPTKQKEMDCIMCEKTMFYSQENLMHVCLNEDHGVLCYYELDNCWFAAKEVVALQLAKKGLKFHIIPQKIFENAGLDPGTFQCDYK